VKTRIPAALSAVVTIAVLGSLCACASRAPKDGLGEVQDLSARIEGVQRSVDAAKARVEAAVKSLQAIAAFNFEDDPADAYAGFVATVDASVAQVAALRASVASMQEAAEPLFRKWEEHLETFASEEIRQRSRERQAETRSRYEAIVSAAESALLAYDAFNRTLNDHVAYLRFDFNAASLAVIQGEVARLQQTAALLDTQFKSCQIAARVYVEAAALPRTIPAPKPDAAPAAEPARSGR